ncbi:MAG: lysoplasmalogenase family protein, partial [Chitinivibrionales bacterium]
MVQRILFSLLSIGAVLLIRAEYRHDRKGILRLKPSCTLLVIALALNGLLSPDITPTLFYGIFAGLTLSLVGDIALIFSENPKAFRTGLIFFLCAHIAYTATFTLFSTISPYDLISGVILIAAAAILYTIMRPRLGAMKKPVILYMVVISIMVN